MKQRLLPFLFATLAAGSVGGAYAQEAASPAPARVNVTPLRLEVASNEKSTQMLVRNHAEEDLKAQIRVFKWQQVDGKDRFSPTDEIVVSPSIVAIRPGHAQAFHVLVRHREENAGEVRYRVVIDQLPDPSRKLYGAAQTRLRLTLPLFEGSDRARTGQLAFSMLGDRLRIDNRGGQAVRLTRISLDAAGRKIPITPTETLGYVFGNSWIELPVAEDLDCGQSKLTVTGLADREQFDAPVNQICT